MRVTSLVVLAALATAAAAEAKVTALGAPTDVSKCAACGERRPAIAGTAAHFMTAFEAGTTAEPAGVFARLTLANGKPKGASFLATPPTQFDSERNPFLASYAGGFLLAWDSLSPQNNYNVLARRFSIAGAPVGDSILLRTEDPTKPASERLPAVAVRADGSFIAVWATTPLAGGTSAPGDPWIEARWFSAAGAPLGNPIKLNTSLINPTAGPSVCIDSTGRAIVAFGTIDLVRPFEPSKQGVAVRRLSAAGAFQGAQLTVAAPLARKAGFALSCGLNGSFVVAWTSDQAPATDAGDILFATYDKTAKRVGAVAQLASSTVGAQESPHLLHDSKGNFVATWESESTLGRSIRARRYLANGKVDGADFLVVDKTAITTRVSRPQVAFLGTTPIFIVEWDEAGRNVFFRRYKAN